MSLRLAEIYLPADYGGGLPLDEDHPALGQWELTTTEDDRLVRVLLETGDTESFLDELENTIGTKTNYRIVLTAVEATVPRPEDDEEAEDEKETGAADQEAEEADDEADSSTSRISREELYQDVNESVRVTSTYYILVILSTIVAAGGMIRDNVAVVIGAMVIAPLIGPSISISLATTLGDTDLLRRSARVAVGGLLLSLGLSVLAGLVIPFDPTVGEIATRTEVALGDVVLGLAAGVAGAISFTRGVSAALIGVMVAVALLPPTVATGLLAGAGEWSLSIRAALLLLTNVSAVNLAGVLTFILQGIRPNRWYEAEQARAATRKAIAGWVLALVLLVIAIAVASGWPVEVL
ncbi:MAG: TIGR00341 family protein [Bacteroidetes bacterium]|jgi:uncharacterized hydrophobic protein (TIGR00341 family)|nr:TIGR00341 family protein [Bacteroidota bacterium]